MVIYLSGDIQDKTKLDEMTPRQIVDELDKYVVGQHAAKQPVGIALRNRVRRQKLSPDLAQDVIPKNIIMIGSTGIGKTEIARRLARLTRSPFLKIEASKFTEVGYVGRDVESMIRDITELAVDMVRQEKVGEIRQRARVRVEERLLSELSPKEGDAASTPAEMVEARERLRDELKKGLLDERSIEVDVRERQNPAFKIFPNAGMEEMNINLQSMMPGLFPGRTKTRRMTVEEAREHFLREEEDRLVDQEEVSKIAVR